MKKFRLPIKRKKYLIKKYKLNELTEEQMLQIIESIKKRLSDLSYENKMH